MKNKTIFDITDFGAVGDGVQHPYMYITGTDNTAAIQACFDAAAKVHGLVIIPPGIYMTGELKLPDGVSLKGFPAWTYGDIGGSTLVLNDPNAKCLLDITNCHGCRIEGIQFYGNRINNKAQGENIHGVYLHWPKMKACTWDEGFEMLDPYMDDHSGYSNPGDNPTWTRCDYIVIDSCQFRNFSGDGLHLYNVEQPTVRNCQMIANLGHGMLLRGWDGWVSNNDFTNNWGYGISDGGDDGFICSLRMDGNRFEFCRMGGVKFNASDSLNLDNNFVDSCFGPGFDLNGTGAHTNTTITGNTFRMNGVPRGAHDHTLTHHANRRPIPFDSEYESCHLRMSNGHNLTVMGNTFIYGRARDPLAHWRPNYGIVYEELEDCTIIGNTMHRGSLIENLVDLGNNKHVVVAMNPGTTDREPTIDWSVI